MGSIVLVEYFVLDSIIFCRTWNSVFGSLLRKWKRRFKAQGKDVGRRRIWRAAGGKELVTMLRGPASLNARYSFYYKGEMLLVLCILRWELRCHFTFDGLWERVCACVKD